MARLIEVKKIGDILEKDASIYLITRKISRKGYAYGPGGSAPVFDPHGHAGIHDAVKVAFPVNNEYIRLISVPGSGIPMKDIHALARKISGGGVVAIKVDAGDMNHLRFAMALICHLYMSGQEEDLRPDLRYDTLPIPTPIGYSIGSGKNLTYSHGKGKLIRWSWLWRISSSKDIKDILRGMVPDITISLNRGAYSTHLEGILPGIPHCKTCSLGMPALSPDMFNHRGWDPTLVSMCEAIRNTLETAEGVNPCKENMNCTKKMIRDYIDRTIAGGGFPFHADLGIVLGTPHKEMLDKIYKDAIPHNTARILDTDKRTGQPVAFSLEIGKGRIFVVPESVENSCLEETIFAACPAKAEATIKPASASIAPTADCHPGETHSAPVAIELLRFDHLKKHKGEVWIIDNEKDKGQYKLAVKIDGGEEIYPIAWRFVQFLGLWYADSTTKGISFESRQRKPDSDKHNGRPAFKVVENNNTKDEDILTALFKTNEEPSAVLSLVMKNVLFGDPEKELKLNGPDHALYDRLLIKKEIKTSRRIPVRHINAKIIVSKEIRNQFKAIKISDALCPKFPIEKIAGMFEIKR